MCVCAGCSTLKGVGCDIGIMEEFTRVDPAVWQEVVVPLLGVNGTAIVAISTPLGACMRYREHPGGTAHGWAHGRIGWCRQVRIIGTRSSLPKKRRRAKRCLM